MGFTLDIDTVRKDLDMLEKGVRVIEDGNWPAVLHEITQGSTKDKILAGIDVAETADKLLAIAFPGQAAAAMAALEFFRFVVVYGKGPADYGDPVWNTHSGEVEGPNPSL